MKSKFPVVLALTLSLLLMASTTLAIASAAQPDQGYVVYKITLSNNGTVTHSVTLNESSTPASQSGFLTMTLKLVSIDSSLTYSKVVNASKLPEVFPYIPAAMLNNQTFSYTKNDVSLTAHIKSAGQSQITFNGNSYQASNYAVSLTATNSSSGKSISTNGNFQIAPSGLLYSLNMQFNSTHTLQAQLLATNLPLTNSSSGASTSVGIAMVGAGVLGSVALAVPSFYKVRRSHRKSGELLAKKSGNETADKIASPDPQQSSGAEAEKNKPSYWVD